MQQAQSPLNLELLRETLFNVEKFAPFAIEDFYGVTNTDEVFNLIQMLVRNGYILTEERSADIHNWIILRLTERGKELLNLLKKEVTWNGLKEIANERDVSLFEIPMIAEDVQKTVFKSNQPANVQQSQFTETPIETEVITSPPYIPAYMPYGFSSQPPPAQTASGASGAQTQTGSSTVTSPPTPTILPADLPPTVRMSNVGDQPTAEDKLGFKPYVEAIAKFLTDENTKGPLTLSVEGEWGSGKSSFMLQVEDELLRIEKRLKKAGGDSQKTRPLLLTVRFNAWRYDKEDALWAAFATQVVRQLKEKVGWRQRYKATWELFWRRFDLSKGWFSLISFGLVIVALLFLVVMTIGGYINNPSQLAESGSFEEFLGEKGFAVLIKFLTLSAAGYIILYILAFRKIKELLINPLSTDLKKHILTPDYKQRATFLDEFHEDFNKIIEAYAGKGDEAAKVFVFIDDLDRCEVPKSAELMQALNLMLSGMPQLFFIIGMDREKVAAGLAVKHEKLLSYLIPLPKNVEETTNPGLEFGFEFIEKFIQVPFKVPQPRAGDIGKLINELSAKKTRKPSIKTPLSTPVETSPPVRAVASPPIRTIQANFSAPTRQIPIRLPKQEDVDSAEVAEVIETVAPFFDYNPRRIKQFLNIYRLKIYIGNETGLFNHPPKGSPYKRINLYKLGRFVALSLRYPLLVAELEDNPRLLDELQDYAFRNFRDAVSSPYWLSKPRLISLLKMNLEDERNRDLDKFALSDINISQLLQVSPATKGAQSSVPSNLRTITSP